MLFIQLWTYDSASHLLVFYIINVTEKNHTEKCPRLVCCNYFIALSPIHTEEKCKGKRKIYLVFAIYSRTFFSNSSLFYLAFAPNFAKCESALKRTA